MSSRSTYATLMRDSSTVFIKIEDFAMYLHDWHCNPFSQHNWQMYANDAFVICSRCKTTRRVVE